MKYYMSFNYKAQMALKTKDNFQNTLTIEQSIFHGKSFLKY